MRRRQFLAAAGAALALPPLALRRGRSAGAEPEAGLPPLVTPSEAFFEVSKNLPWLGGDPRIDAAGFRLAVGGLVRRPLALSLGDLGRLPADTVLATLACISNEVGGPLIGTAFWRGVPLRRLLAEADPRPAARTLVAHCADGYWETLPTAVLDAEPAWLAYEMNGAPLPRGHGFPVRLLLPARYGLKSAKWVVRIELSDEPERSYWTRRGGWDGAAFVRTSSQILVPRPFGAVPREGVTVAGVAHAGARGISGVELSADGRRTWHPAAVEPAASPVAWVRFRWRWRPDRETAVAEGRHVLQVRAVDGQGTPQIETDQPPFPSGATGLHGVLVHVRG